MTTQESATFTSVWDAIEADPVQARALAQRCELCARLLEHIRQQGWGVEQAARHMGTPSATVSALLSGNIDALELATLESMCQAAGLAQTEQKR